MKNTIISALLFFSATNVLADIIKYEDVSTAGARRFGDIVVRHVRTLGSPCLDIQALSWDSEWKVVSARNFCSFEGKSFETDVTDASFENIYFARDGIQMDLSLTPLAPTGETIRTCFVRVKDGRIGDIVCSAPRRPE